MIASLAAVGLGSGLGGSSGGSGVPIIDDEETPPVGVTEITGSAFPDGPVRDPEAILPHKAILVTNEGDIEIDLFTDAAPEAVNSFAFLAENGFYNGTFFFFVDPDFVAQVGDPTCVVDGESVCTGLGGPGYHLPLEKTAYDHEEWAVVAPALPDGQRVHGSQFRILFNADERLDGKETVFGKVVAGQEILKDLSDFVPCTVIDTDICEPNPGEASKLVIEKVVVEGA